MNFDKIYLVEYDNYSVECGFVVGNNKIVYIKVGMGGSYLGYEEKYLRIARRLNEKYGCSVICVSNPTISDKKTRIDQLIIEKFIAEHKIQAPEFYFFGQSNGGMKGLELAANGIQFKKMILVNMPLMLNIHKTLTWIKAIPHTNIVAIYGEKDPSFSYVRFLKDLNFANVEVITIPNADHHFKGNLEKFIELSDRLLE